jgi:hypothetical protein
MMTIVPMLVAVLLQQQQSAPSGESETERVSERRSSISLRTLLPVGTGGSASHKDDGPPAVNLDYPVSHVEPSVNLSLSLDLGPFTLPTHIYLGLDFNRIGFATQEPGQGSKVLRGDKGEWLSVELLAGLDWLAEDRTRVVGGLSFGYHQVAYTLIDPAIHDADVSASAGSIGFQFAVQHPLGSGFRIEAEFRAAFMPNWGGGTEDLNEEENHGYTVFLTAGVSWEPVRGLSLHAGYALWNGHFDQETTALFSTSTVSNTVDLKANGPLLGIVWAF